MPPRARAATPDDDVDDARARSKRSRRRARASDDDADADARRLDAARSVAASSAVDAGDDGTWTTTMPSDWARTCARAAAVASSGTSSAFAFVGPRNVGKSALARRCANAVIDAVGACAWLDIDCGQPELTAPGMVSLTIVRTPLREPGATNSASAFAGVARAPLYAGFVGDISPQGDPEAYARGALACVRAWAALGADKPPLVVNTSGWVKGLGLELAEEVLREVGARADECHVVNINSHVASRNVPDGTRWFVKEDGTTRATVRAFEVAAVSSAPPRAGEGETEETSADAFDVAPSTTPNAGAEVRRSRDPRRTANDSRALTWLAWARQTVAACDDKPREGALDLDAFGGENEAFASTAAALTSATPWRVSFDDITLCVPHKGLSARAALMACNGAVVGLLKTPQPSEPSSSNDAHAECVGLGLVRGIDVHQRAMYVLTPTPMDRLRDVVALSLGSLELPTKLLAPNGESPYTTVGAITNDGTGSKAIGGGRRDVLRQNTACKT